MVYINLIEIGKRLRNSRESHGLTREQLAEAVDLSSRFICDIEFGNKGMSIDTLAMLSQVLDIPADYILLGQYREYTASELQVLALLEKLPESKLPYLEEIIKNFILGIR